MTDQQTEIRNLIHQQRHSLFAILNAILILFALGVYVGNYVPYPGSAIVNVFLACLAAYQVCVVWFETSIWYHRRRLLHYARTKWDVYCLGKAQL